jgi:LysM repeat protein
MRQSRTVSAVFFTLALLLGSWLASMRATAFALPGPAAVSVAAVGVSDGRWVSYRIIPGDRLNEIAERYRVAVGKLLEWNRLDAEQPVLRVGHELRVFTEAQPTQRERQSYSVRPGDSWSKLAKRFGVEQQRLRTQWNPRVEALKPGEKLTVWREAATPSVTGDAPQLLAMRESTGETPLRSVQKSSPHLPIIEIPSSGISTGTANRGRLVGGVQLPRNDALYSIRNPANSWGSSLMIRELQRGVRDFRERTGFDRELVMNDLSRERGGRFRPHRSHTSGRDVDIRLPIRLGVAKGTIPRLGSQVDWDATWALIQAFADGEQLQYVFLSRSRQQALLEAAKRAGATEAELVRFIQYPRHSRTAVVRHAHGHTEHIHVRFKCAANETSCSEP